MADLLPPLDLKEVAPLVKLTIKSAQHKLARGRFPIRHIDGQRPYLFTRADVLAFVERGEITNPQLRPPSTSRHFFGRARRRA